MPALVELAGELEGAKILAESAGRQVEDKHVHGGKHWGLARESATCS
jgi:hypothetical protein